jgi:radical SAM superfamily enzyme YgiQ (UPF0313 family)
VHDLLTVDLQFISEFCDSMLDARLPVEWMANSRTDIQLRCLLPKMKAAGCWKLFFGVESASPRIQASIHKHLRPDGALATIRELLDNGISATCSFVIGFPDESAAELSSTIDLAARLKLWGVETVQFHRLRLWPPAPLSRSGVRAEFDEDSLRIEYLFIDVPQEDMNYSAYLDCTADVEPCLIRRVRRRAQGSHNGSALAVSSSSTALISFC